MLAANFKDFLLTGSQSFCTNCSKIKWETFRHPRRTVVCVGSSTSLPFRYTDIFQEKALATLHHAELRASRCGLCDIVCREIRAKFPVVNGVSSVPPHAVCYGYVVTEIQPNTTKSSPKFYWIHRKLKFYWLWPKDSSDFVRVDISKFLTDEDIQSGSDHDRICLSDPLHRQISGYHERLSRSLVNHKVPDTIGTDIGPSLLSGRTQDMQFIWHVPNVLPDCYSFMLACPLGPIEKRRGVTEGPFQGSREPVPYPSWSPEGWVGEMELSPVTFGFIDYPSPEIFIFRKWTSLSGPEISLRFVNIKTIDSYVTEKPTDDLPPYQFHHLMYQRQDINCRALKHRHHNGVIVFRTFVSRAFFLEKKVPGNWGVRRLFILPEQNENEPQCSIVLPSQPWCGQTVDWSEEDIPELEKDALDFIYLGTSNSLVLSRHFTWFSPDEGQSMDLNVVGLLATKDETGYHRRVLPAFINAKRWHLSQKKEETIFMI